MYEVPVLLRDRLRGQQPRHEVSERAGLKDDLEIGPVLVYLKHTKTLTKERLLAFEVLPMGSELITGFLELGARRVRFFLLDGDLFT